MHAVFGQVRTTRDLFAKGTVAAGARYNAPTHAESRAVWNVTGRYDFTDNTFTRATVGTPFAPLPGRVRAVRGRPDVLLRQPEPQAGREHELQWLNRSSIRHQHDENLLTFEAIGFYRRVTDLIVDVDDGSGETTITANRPDQVRVRGVTLIGSAAVSRASV